MKLSAIIGFIAVVVLAFVAIGLTYASYDVSALSGLIIAPAVAVAWIKNEKFVELSEEELKDFDAETLAGYYNALNKHNKDEMQKLIDSKGEQKDIDDLKEKYNKLIDEQVKNLNKALEEQGLKIQKMSKSEDDKPVSRYVSIRKALNDNIEDLKALKGGDAKKIKIDLKAVGNMTITGNVTGEVPQAQREPGLNVIAVRRPFILDLIQRAQATSNVVSWVEQTGKEGGAGGTDEGTLKNQADFDLVVASENIVKRTVFIKASSEMLDDIDFMANEINNELIRLLSLDIDDQVLNGDGVDPNVNGIITQATAFAAGSFANAIDEANNWDVLKVAINQIIIANFQPNYIVMHPSDVTAMGLTKDVNGNYILPPFQSSEGMQVSGVRIVENTGITVDNFLVMDGSRATAFFKEDINVEVGFDSDDFTKNFRTIKAEARLLLRIKGNDTTAFVTGTFTAAKAALETP